MEPRVVPEPDEADITARFHVGQKSLKPPKKVIAPQRNVTLNPLPRAGIGVTNRFAVERHLTSEHIDGRLRERTRVGVVPTDERPTLTMIAKARNGVKPPATRSTSTTSTSTMSTNTRMLHHTDVAPQHDGRRNGWRRDIQRHVRGLLRRAIFAASHGSLTMPTQRTPYGTRQGKVTLALPTVHRSGKAF